MGKHHALPAILYAAIFTVLCISGPVHESTETETLFGQPRVKLSLGNYPITSETISGKIKSSDLQMLGHFAELKEADFRGSDCAEQIAVWAEANPDVQVKYDVRMPNGETLDNNITELDLSSYSSGDVPALLDALAYLKNVTSVKLGAVGGTGMQMADVKSLKEKLPGASFEFSFDLNGKIISPDAESLDLTDIGSDGVDDALAVAACLDKLTSVTLGSAFTLDDIAALAKDKPNVTIDYPITLYGRETNLNAEELDFSYVKMSDNGAQISRVLPMMKNLRTLDMDTTGVSYEALEKMRADNPNVDIIWRVWFGENYSVRTDAERILASKPTVGGMITDETAWVLKYCTKVKYLDIGHNDEITTGEFLHYMPDLEACIIAMTGITDISGLAKCPKLNYLELNSTNVSDISMLSACTALRDFNIVCCPNITDISSMYDIPLDRFWIGRDTSVPAEQIAEMKRRQTGCNVNTTAIDPVDDYWRYTRYDPEEPKYYWVPRYEQLREEMGYNYQEYSFYWLDPKCTKAAPPEHAGKYGRQVYG